MAEDYKGENMKQYYVSNKQIVAFSKVEVVIEATKGIIIGGQFIGLANEYLAFIDQFKQYIAEVEKPVVFLPHEYPSVVEAKPGKPKGKGGRKSEEPDNDVSSD